MSNTEISSALFIATTTTKIHVERLLAKLGLRDRAQAVVVAYETGLVTPSDLHNPWSPRHRGQLTAANPGSKRFGEPLAPA